MANISRTSIPEWLDAKGVHHSFAICKSTAYRLASEGTIRSVSLRERGKLRGKRLFSYDSISAYIEKMANTQQPSDEPKEMAVVNGGQAS